jgi:5-formyltetrahydrofolate cyclo-ligase
MSINDDKHQARTLARTKRKSIPDRPQLNKSICRHIIDSTVWSESTCVLTYFAAGSEVDLSELFVSPEGRHADDLVEQNPSVETLGPKTFGAPIVEGENMRFGHVRIKGNGSPQTTLGPYGLREPDGPPVTVSEVGLVLVPLLAYDTSGNRLGSGKGFYDRFFAAHPKLGEHAVIIGVAYSAQGVDALPIEPHDYPLDAVVTELGITTWRTFKRSGKGNSVNEAQSMKLGRCSQNP